MTERGSVSVSSSTSRIVYAGNNSLVTAYAVPFYFEENAHLNAIAKTAAGVETVVTLTNHTGAGNENGGTVRTAVAVPATSTLTIYREVPFTQATSYEENDAFPAASHERALDKLTTITQQLERRITNCIRGTEATPLSPIPSPTGTQQFVLSAASNQPPSWQELPVLAAGPVVATGSTQARFISDRFADVVNVKDFGAVGDGVTDDTAAIQAAINFAALGHKIVTSLSGLIFRITGTINIDQNNVSLLFNRSTLHLDDPSGLKDHLYLGNGSVQRYHLYLKDIIFTRAQAATAGYAIKFDNIGVSYVQDCLIYGDSKIHGGISIRHGIINYIERTYIDKCVNYGIYVVGALVNGGAGLPTQRTIDVTIRGSRIEYCHDGLHIWDNVEGIFCRDNIFYANTNNSVRVNATSAAAGLVSFKFQNNDFDTTTGTGVFVDKISNIQFTDNWFSSNGFSNGVASHLYVGPDAEGLVVDANQIYSASGDTSNNIRIDGNDAVVSSNLMNGGGGTALLLMGVLYAVTGNSIKYYSTGINAYSANKYTAVGNHFELVTTPIGIGTGTPVLTVANNGAFGVGTKVYNPPSIAAGNFDSTTVAVSGAYYGDAVSVGFTNHGSGNGILIYGYVSNDNEVTVIFRNPTAGAIDLPSGTICVSVSKTKL